MALDLRLQVKLSQQLVMTPQLQQAIKLLQLSRLELVDAINEELMENPILEEGVDAQEEQEEKLRSGSDDEVAPAVENSPEEELSGQGEGVEDIDWQTYLEGYSLSSTGNEARDHYEEQEERPSFESLMTQPQRLTDHLLWQLGMMTLPNQIKQAAADIIGNLDGAGYLQASLDELATAAGLPLDAYRQALQQVQQFDPAGIAGTNLQECLLLQLERLGLSDSLAATLLRDFIVEIEGRKYQQIAKALKCPLEDVFAATKLISDLDPRPGSAYNDEEPHYIIPDIFVHKIGDDYVVSQNDEGLPSLRISNFYRGALNKTTEVDKKTNEYIQDKMRSAVWLIKSIHQRQRTIYKVTQSIVKFQRDFFEKGIEHLRPMVLRDVAEDIQMHESTVSRVTTNKYVQTPQGLFELKYFFNSGINTTGGDSVASESVKNRIRDIVAAEDPKKPWSDQKIVDLLEKCDVNIARRTVTKYREMLGIGSSTERKRLF